MVIEEEMLPIMLSGVCDKIITQNLKNLGLDCHVLPKIEQLQMDWKEVWYTGDFSVWEVVNSGVLKASVIGNQ